MYTFCFGGPCTYKSVPNTFSYNHFPPSSELHFGQSDHRTHPMQTKEPCTAPISPSVAAVFFLIHFSLSLFPPLLLVILYSEIVCRNNFVTYLCTLCIYCLCNKSIKNAYINTYIHTLLWYINEKTGLFQIPSSINISNYKHTIHIPISVIILTVTFIIFPVFKTGNMKTTTRSP